MKKAERFSIYRHSFVYGNNLIVTKQFIVLNHADGTRTFTDFHRYVENPNKKVKKFNEDGNNRFIFINKFLNYAFFTIGISSLSDLTIDIGRNFLNAYGMHELPDDMILMIILAFCIISFRKITLKIMRCFGKPLNQKIIQIHGFILHFTLFVHFE